MSDINWINPAGGDFVDGNNWAGDVTPGPGDTAILGALGGRTYGVADYDFSQVGAVQTAANAQLTIFYLFQVYAGTGNGANAGEILVGNDATFFVDGSFDNPGQLLIERGTVDLGGSRLTLSGGGAVEMNQGGLVGSSGSELDNIDNIISGNGGIGVVNLVNERAGVIDATGSFTIRNTVVNSGLIESVGGNLDFFLGNIYNQAGVITASDNSTVTLDGVTLTGGSLNTSGSGQIVCLDFDSIKGTVTVDARSGELLNQGTLALWDGASITVGGNLNNSAKIGLASQGASTSLMIDATGVTLSGGGRVILSDNEANRILGVTSSASLTNVDNTLSGAGQLGGGSLVLVNQAKGVIVGSLADALVIDTGANTVTNAGLVVAKGAGGVTIQSAIDNSGRLEADGGVLTVNGAVSGSGEGVIAGGTLDLASNFTQRVVFTGANGVLELGQSQSYTGSVFGFSKAGGTSLDLRDIGFVNSTEASFLGTANGGVLTVSDGIHTAHISLKGDYRASVFTANSDGHGGVIVVDPATSIHRFIAAAASFNRRPFGPESATQDPWRPRPETLARPGVVTA